MQLAKIRTESSTEPPSGISSPLRPFPIPCSCPRARTQLAKIRTESSTEPFIGNGNGKGAVQGGGVLVVTVRPGGPADVAGVQVGPGFFKHSLYCTTFLLLHGMHVRG